MSTRCRIAIETAWGAYQSIYCHWDGSPDVVGELLRNHYGSADLVRALLLLGDLSTLGAELGEQHSGNDRTRPEWCTAYGRDLGEPNAEARTSRNLAALRGITRQTGGEWLYVFRPGVGWHAAKGGTSFFGCAADVQPGDLLPLDSWLQGSAP